VEVKHRQLAFDLSARSFTTVEGLNLFAATITSDSNSSYLVLDGLNAKYLSHYSLIPIGGGGAFDVGILDSGIILNGKNNVLRSSTLNWSAGNGVGLSGSGHHVFNNLVENTDYTPTLSSPIAASDYTVPTGLIIAWNTISKAGREGILHGVYKDFAAGRILHNDTKPFTAFGVVVGRNDLRNAWSPKGTHLLAAGSHEGQDRSNSQWPSSAQETRQIRQSIFNLLIQFNALMTACHARSAMI
jgi:hypothetical protein